MSHQFDAVLTHRIHLTLDTLYNECRKDIQATVPGFASMERDEEKRVIAGQMVAGTIIAIVIAQLRAGQYPEEVIEHTLKDALLRSRNIQLPDLL